MKIPLCKPSIDNNEIDLVSKTLKSSWLTHGPYNNKFEELFNKKFNTKYSIAMNSCTSALECAIKSLGVKGEIIIPSFTWVSTANAVLNCGSKPVFADIDFNTRNIDLKNIIKSITKKTVAVIVVHFAGLPCDMNKISKFCKKKKIKIIEDSAETLGAKTNGKYTGTFGIGCFSFFPTKNITTTEGGMLTTNDKKVYHYVKKLIAHGIDKDVKSNFWHREAVLPGHNFRMPNHLAAMGYVQLKKIKKFNKVRNNIARLYNSKLLKITNKIKVPYIPKGYTHSFQMYTITVEAKLRNKLLNFLKKNNIGASAHFDPPLHLQKYLKKYNKKKLIETEKLSNQILTLPIFPDMTKKEVIYVTETINRFYKKKNL
jgi:perosamine synthetase